MTLSPGLSDGIAAAVHRALRSAPIPRVMPATVVSIDPTNVIAEVVADGPDEVPFGAQMLNTVVFPGDRVEILFVEPHGAFVLGRRAGDFDPWHVVGTDGEPVFGAGWVNLANTFDPTFGDATNGFAPKLMFRRAGRIVNIRGRVGRSSGTGMTITTLPPDYRPENSLTFLVGNGLVAAVVIEVQRGGDLVWTGLGPGSPDAGDGCSLDSITYTTNPPLVEGE